jgi:hypothetical protein
MAATRTFNIVIVTPNHGTGESPTPTPDKSITYKGASTSTHL